MSCTLNIAIRLTLLIVVKALGRNTLIDREIRVIVKRIKTSADQVLLHLYIILLVLFLDLLRREVLVRDSQCILLAKGHLVKKVDILFRSELHFMGLQNLASFWCPPHQARQHGYLTIEEYYKMPQKLAQAEARQKANEYLDAQKRANTAGFYAVDELAYFRGGHQQDW